MTSINGLAIKLSDTSLDVSNLGLQVSTTYKSELQQLKMIQNMDARQCGNDRPGFGVHSISEKLSAITFKTLLRF